MIVREKVCYCRYNDHEEYHSRVQPSKHTNKTNQQGRQTYRQTYYQQDRQDKQTDDLPVIAAPTRLFDADGSVSAPPPIFDSLLFPFFVVNVSFWLRVGNDRSDW